MLSRTEASEWLYGQSDSSLFDKYLDVLWEQHQRIENLASIRDTSQGGQSFCFKREAGAFQNMLGLYWRLHFSDQSKYSFLMQPDFKKRIDVITSEFQSFLSEVNLDYANKIFFSRNKNYLMLEIGSYNYFIYRFYCALKKLREDYSAYQASVSYYLTTFIFGSQTSAEFEQDVVRHFKGIDAFCTSTIINRVTFLENQYNKILQDKRTVVQPMEKLIENVIVLNHKRKICFWDEVKMDGKLNTQGVSSNEKLAIPVSILKKPS